MKRFILTNIALMCIAQLYAQVKSSHDGFYSNDSVFYQLSGAESFKYCVNCYSADSLHTYTGGVWLYSREHAPNTWENGEFSETKNSESDKGRPNVVKANTVWVRIYKDGRYIDQHHLVFLGNWRPKTAETVSIYVDSSDFMGPDGFYGSGADVAANKSHFKNYLLSFKKTCSYQVFSVKDLKPEAEQTAYIELGGMRSRANANKTLQLNVGKKTNNDKFLLLGKSLTDSLGSDIKVVRFSVGGSSYHGNIISNEIAVGIIRPDGGGKPSTPVCVFVNGSFWSYALAEENLGPNLISKTLKTPVGQIVSTKVQSTITVPDVISLAKKVGFTTTPVGNSLIAVSGYHMSRLFYSFYDTVQFEVDTTDAGYRPAAFDEICNLVKTGSDAALAASINRESFFRYALSVWFFHNEDAWGSTHLVLAKPGAKPWVLLADHYNFAPDSAAAIDWDKYFTHYHLPEHDGLRPAMPWHATQRMLKYDPDYFCLVVEDELNTTYKVDRITAIAQKDIALLRPCINECSRAWGVNGWMDSVDWDASVSRIISFLRDRPAAIAAALPKNFMPAADTLLTVNDMNEVKIKFDGVRGKDVTVQLNSLDITSDFSGKYYLRPELRISLKYDTGKYKFAGWLEYPNAPATFKLSAKTPITLTPELVALKK